MSKKKQRSRPESEKTTAPNSEGMLSLVIPCYNESKRVPKLIKCLETFDQNWTTPYEIILVDDGSSDSTSEVLQKALADSKLPAIYQIHTLAENVGKGGALQAGVALAKGDFILTLDADMATDPLELKKWLQQIPGQTFDSEKILIGSRENQDSQVKGQLLRRLAGLIYNFIIQLFTNLPFADTQCGFKLYPAKIGQALFGQLKSKGWSHDVELLYAASIQGIPIESMPISWEHQDDSKISLLRDSIRMFWDTLAIAFRLNWIWLIRQPIVDLRQGIYKRKEPSFYRLLFVLLTLALLFGMPWLSFDYGITGDEHLQQEYGEKVLAYFQTDGVDRSALEFENLYYYGGLFDYLAVWSHQFAERWDIYDWRHFLNSLFGFTMIFFTGLLAKELGKSWRMAFLAMLFMALSPRIFGHSMNNPKDIPFAAAYAFTLLYLLRYFYQMPRPGVKTMVCLIIGIAWAINIRVGGVLLIAYLGLLPLLRYFLPLKGHYAFSNFSSFFRFGLQLLPVAALGYWGGLQFWPYGLEAPFSNPLKALQEMSNFSTSIRMLFEGAHLWSDELPWYYIPKWFLISSPLFLLTGVALMLSFMILYRKKMPMFPLLVLVFTSIFPVSYAAIKGASLYDGMRHFLFVFPALAVLSSFGWHQLLSLKGHRFQQIAVRLILGLLLLLSGLWMWRNHPHQYVYFNELEGGSSHAYSRYEMDYWMNSAKGMSEWLAQNARPTKTGEPIRVVTNCANPVSYYLQKLAPEIEVTYAKFYDRHKYPADYYVFISRFVDHNFMKRGVWPPKEVVYQESVDGVPLGTVSKRLSLDDFAAQEALDTANFAQAIELFERAIALDSLNDAALLGLTDAAMRGDSLDQMRRAAEQLVNLSDTYVNGLFALGVYLYNTKDFGNAQIVFERIRQLNYKFNACYYYLATLYAGQRNLEEAVRMMEIFDRENGTLPKAFTLAIELCKASGQEYKELYFRAKLAYLQKDLKNSMSLVNQSIAINPNYEPAKKMYDAYQRAINKKK